jgi:glycosyltransferase involved in cell wall biosynthesis
MVFTPSAYVKQQAIKRLGIENVIVTPNGVDHTLFHPGAKQTRLDLPACYILFVGTLEPRKNLNLLIQAWEQIKDDFRETGLVIAGVSGSVFRQVHYARPMERVHFLGYVDDETLAGLYANAMLFVLPSQQEGFGLTALEAMASGAPVVVSDGGALPEVVGEAGMIFCLSDPHELAEALREGLSSAALRSALREKGLRRAREFSWQTTAASIWKSLDEI